MNHNNTLEISALKSAKIDNGFVVKENPLEISILKTIDMAEYYLNISKIFLGKAKKWEIKEVLDEKNYEYVGFILNSFISSVTGLEAYVEYCLRELGITYLDTSNDRRNKVIIAIEKLYLLKQEKMSDDLPIEEIQKIISLRNQYIHYDYELMDGDQVYIVDDVKYEKQKHSNEAGKKIKTTINYFKDKINENTFDKSIIFKEDNLYPLGILSSSFVQWVLENVNYTINKIEEDINIRKPNFTLNE